MKTRIATSLMFVALLTTTQAQQVFHDDFSYADGSLTTNSGFLWVRHSGGGGANDVLVKDGKIEVFASRSEDVSRFLTNATLSAAGPVIYASFVLNSTNLPPASSNYFAHFKDNGPSNFRNRLYAARGQAPNSWRLAMAAAAGATTTFPLDLATNVDYRVVMAYDTNNFLGTLWIDPTVEADQKVLTGDVTTGLVITTIAFRQSNTAGTTPSLVVDDLYVGNSFGDIGVGDPKATIVYYQPPAAILVNELSNTNIPCVAGGAGTVTFQWQKEESNISDDGVISGTTSGTLTFTGTRTTDAGNYRVIVTSTTNGVFAGSVTSSVCALTVNATPRPPEFVTHPQSRTITIGSQVSFTSLADGSSPLTYQWYIVTNSITNQLTGETSPNLVFTVPDSSAAGQYFAEATNPFGVTNSQLATLTVIPPIATNIAYLRTLMNTNTWQPNETNLMYQAEGVVTVHTNTTGLANVQFYMQDSTAGIVVFVGGLSGATSQPHAGDIVRVIGQLGSFNNLFEFNLTTANPYHSVQVLSTGNPMPLSRSFNDFSLATNLPVMETQIEGSLVTITNVYFPTGGTGANFTAGQTLTISNAAGQTFTLFINGTALFQTNPPVPIPAFAYEVTGVMGQFASTYQLLPTRYVDIVSNLPAPFSLSVTRSGNVSTVTWPAVDGSTYSIYSAGDVAGPYSKLFGLNFLNGAGSYSETNAAAARFYRASSP